MHVMLSNTRIHQNAYVIINGKEYQRQTVLADVNIPYKFSIDRNRNCLFFCINADEFSNQSFHSVLLSLDTGVTSIIPSIRNGFASAVNQGSGDVYLGGSDGIFKFNYDTLDVQKPSLVHGIDIFDMYFEKELYFVDTGNQNLFIYKNHKWVIVSELKGYLIHHFIVGANGDIVFVSPMGLFNLPKGSKTPILYDDGYLNFRGVAADLYGTPHFITQDGIYKINEENKQLVRLLTVENGYGLAFDNENNIIYSDERSMTKLVPC